jgi:hypothetical protein
VEWPCCIDPSDAIRISSAIRADATNCNLTSDQDEIRKEDGSEYGIDTTLAYPFEIDVSALHIRVNQLNAQSPTDIQPIVAFDQSAFDGWMQ